MKQKYVFYDGRVDIKTMKIYRKALTVASMSARARHDEHSFSVWKPVSLLHTPNVVDSENWQTLI